MRFEIAFRNVLVALSIRTTKELQHLWDFIHQVLALEPRPREFRPTTPKILDPGTAPQLVITAKHTLYFNKHTEWSCSLPFSVCSTHLDREFHQVKVNLRRPTCII